MSSSHKRHNHIRSLRINGVWSNEDGSLCKDIVGAFQALLSDHGEWRENIQGLNLCRIFGMDVTSLGSPFSTEEVLVALSNMNGDKAPSPNGFTAAFWQSN